MVEGPLKDQGHLLVKTLQMSRKQVVVGWEERGHGGSGFGHLDGQVQDLVLAPLDEGGDDFLLEE